MVYNVPESPSQDRSSKQCWGQRVHCSLFLISFVPQTDIYCQWIETKTLPTLF